MRWKREWYSRLFGLLAAVLLAILIPYDRLPDSFGRWKLIVLVTCGFGIGTVAGRVIFALQERIRAPNYPHNGAKRECSDEPLILVIIPALVEILAIHEREKGSALTEAEVLEIRNKSVCMVLPLSEAAKLAEGRGFDDIDPDDAWNQWQAIRGSFEFK